MVRNSIRECLASCFVPIARGAGQAKFSRNRFASGHTRHDVLKLKNRNG